MTTIITVIRHGREVYVERSRLRDILILFFYHQVFFVSYKKKKDGLSDNHDVLFNFMIDVHLKSSFVYYIKRFELSMR